MKWYHLRLGTAFTMDKFVFCLSLSVDECPPLPNFNYLVKKLESGIKEKSDIVLKIFCCALEWDYQFISQYGPSGMEILEQVQVVTLVHIADVLPRTTSLK
jgi:hypothetical protein